MTLFYYVAWTYIANFSLRGAGGMHFEEVEATGYQEAIDKAWGFYVKNKDDSFRLKARFVITTEDEPKPWVGSYREAQEEDAKAQEAEARTRSDWKRERAMEAGMGLGVEGFNDAMGY